jgi:hypothetical protein
MRLKILLLALIMVLLAGIYNNNKNNRYILLEYKEVVEK